MPQPKQLQRLARLNTLAGDPAAQVAYAAELAHSERNDQVLRAALAVLAEMPDPAARPVLLERYGQFDADGVAFDPGGYVRAALLRALRPLAQPADIPLLERAASTYEFLPPSRSEETWPLRAEALLALDEVAAETASFHAVRLLNDIYTSPMSGEPACTAARLLANQGHTLPLYGYAVRSAAQSAVRQPDVVAECLRHLTSLPESIFMSIIELYRNSTDEIALVGLFDLVLGHPARAVATPFLAEWLRETRVYHAYHYLATLIVASRNRPLIDLLLATVPGERDARKQDLLHEALLLGQGDAAIDAALTALHPAR